MQLKRRPEDFRVRELLDFAEVPNGPYYVHLLRKEKLSTHEALSSIARVCGVDRADIAYAGLKDRQAITQQFITVKGRPVDINGRTLNVRAIGRTDRAITSKMSRGNEFQIVIRDLSTIEAAQVRRDLPSLLRTGFPNYFDDQRFGSLRHGQGFPMLKLLRGEYEDALRQLIASPSPAAMTGDVKLKTILSQRWGDWQACLSVVRGPVYRPVFEHLLRHPDDFRGALTALPTRSRLIHAFAFQSYLWNRALSRMVKPWIPGAKRLVLDTMSGRLCAWRYMGADREKQLQEMETPLFAADGSGGSRPFRDAMVEELDNLRLSRENFLAHELPGMILKEEQRAAIVKPDALELVQLARDECTEGRMKAELRFELPRGSYATMLIKRLFGRPWFDGRSRDGGDGRRPDRDRDRGGDRGRPRGHGQDRGRGGYRDGGRHGGGGGGGGRYQRRDDSERPRPHSTRDPRPPRSSDSTRENT